MVSMLKAGLCRNDGGGGLDGQQRDILSGDHCLCKWEEWGGAGGRGGRGGVLHCKILPLLKQILLF